MNTVIIFKGNNSGKVIKQYMNVVRIECITHSVFRLYISHDGKYIDLIERLELNSDEWFTVSGGKF